MSDSDSIIGHSDYLTDESLRVVVLKNGRTVRKMKRYNRDSDSTIGPQKLIRVRKAGVPLSFISQSSIPDLVDGHVPTTNVTDARNVDIPSSHKPAFAHLSSPLSRPTYLDQLTKHSSRASKHQKKRDDSALRNHDTAKCTLAKNVPAHPEVATRRSVVNPCYRPNPTLPSVKKHNRVLTEVLRLNRLAKSHRETNKLCKDMNNNRNQPIVTKGKYLPISSKESCFDGEGLQENHKINRPKQEVQERKQIGDLGWLQEYEENLPLLTEIRMADSLPVQIVGHSHLNHSEVTVQNKHLSNIEPTQTDGPHVNWVQEFEVDKLVQEQTHNVEEPNMSVPETSSSSRNFNSPINDDNVDTVEHNIDSIDDSRENTCVEQNKVITLSNKPSLKKLFTNVRHSSTPPGEKNVTGDDKLLGSGSQSQGVRIQLVHIKEDPCGESQKNPHRSKDNNASSGCQSELRADGPSNVFFTGPGKEIDETIRDYLSDASIREPSSAFMNSLDVMPPTPRYIKQELLTDDEDSIQPRTSSTNRQQASLRRLEVVNQSSIRNNTHTHDRNKNAANARSRTRVEADSDSETSVNVLNETTQRNDAQNKQDSQHHVVEITHPAPRGSSYSEKERRNIVAYIVQQKAYKLLKGKKFWEEMEFDRVCPGRTWQSLKEHFHKSVTRCIRKYVTAEELIKFTKGYSRSRRSEELMGHRANYYTKKENQTLIACMLKYRRYKYVGGNSVWRRLEAKEILPGRTWQSLRNHYRKVLVHNLNGMDVTEAEAAALRTYCPALSPRSN